MASGALRHINEESRYWLSRLILPRNTQRSKPVIGQRVILEWDWSNKKNKLQTKLFRVTTLCRGFLMSKKHFYELKCVFTIHCIKTGFYLKKKKEIIPCF